MDNEQDLPEGWEWTKLGDVVAPTRIGVQSNELPLLPYVGMEHIESETMKLIGIGSASDLKSNTMHFWSGDVLYGRMRPYLNKVFRPDFEGLCSPELLVFRESSNLSSRYLQYFLNSWHFKTFASHLVEGDRPRVDWGQLHVFPFPLPPLPEQQRIVSALEEQFTRLDAAIASLQQDKARLKQARASVLKSAVEGTLTETWRATHPDIEPAKELLERILIERREKWEADLRAKGKDPAKAKYVEPVAPDTEMLHELPEGWCWATVEQLASTDKYSLAIGPFGSNLKVEDYCSQGVPLVFVKNIRSENFDEPNTRYITQEKADELHAHRVVGGDILITKMGAPPGDVCIYPETSPPAIITADCIKWTLSASFVYRNFFVNAIKTPLVRSQILSITNGVAQLKVSLGRFIGIALPLPPLIEQQQIVAEVEARLSVIAQAETAVETSLKRAARTRQSILQKAFSGQLVPQDPNDEPASVLLKRIYAEREKREQGKNIRKRRANIVNIPPPEPGEIDVSEMQQEELWERVNR